MGTYALAIDLGASGGRHILGHREGDRITLTEVYRFTNEMVRQDGQLCWDREALFGHVLAGMRACATQGMIPATVGIDTWGVDYALIDAAGNPVGRSVAYRDARTDGLPEQFDRAVAPGALYAATGIARQSYNTLYQLLAEGQSTPEHHAAGNRLLFTPCYLSYRLCGVAQNEYTIASTSGMLDAASRNWAPAILRAAAIPQPLLGGQPAAPGTLLGPVTPEVANAIGYTCDVVLVASHDTASAYLATPVSGGHPAVLSSGTWSLLGMELEAPVLTEAARAGGFTNEGGFGGKITFLRNIMGLWILQSIRREWQNRLTYAQMSELARDGQAYTYTFNAADERFLAPQSMAAEIAAALAETGAPVPESDAQLLYCVHHSLALCYRDAIAALGTLTGRPVTALHVTGGGSQNRTLNQLTASATGLPVYAGPVEATAFGNLAVQWVATGALHGADEARRLVRNSAPLEEYRP